MGLKDLCTEEIADRGIDIDIYHPASGEDLGIVVCMRGSDSEEYLLADRKIKNRQLEHAKRKKDFTVGMSPEEQDAALVEKMAACFIGWKERTSNGWKNSVEFEAGVELPSTREEFKKIISRRGFYWFRQQVVEGMDKVTNFLPKQQQPSVPLPVSDSNTILPEKTI